jgi:hypothetical protein
VSAVCRASGPRVITRRLDRRARQPLECFCTAKRATHKCSWCLDLSFGVTREDLAG